jgi:hypothetical protein
LLVQKENETPTLIDAKVGVFDMWIVLLIAGIDRFSGKVDRFYAGIDRFCSEVDRFASKVDRFFMDEGLGVLFFMERVPNVAIFL